MLLHTHKLLRVPKPALLREVAARGCRLTNSLQAHVLSSICAHLWAVLPPSRVMSYRVQEGGGAGRLMSHRVLPSG